MTLSNLAQYQVAGPSFGGMSGVVYGLLGYVWLRGRLDPASGLHVDRQTMLFMVIWFFLCLFHIIPNVANAAHGAGFAVGLLWGGMSARLGAKPWFSGLHKAVSVEGKRDPAKPAVAARLMRETILTTGGIATRLQMGTRKNAAIKLHRWGKERHPAHGTQDKSSHGTYLAPVPSDSR